MNADPHAGAGRGTPLSARETAQHLGGASFPLSHRVFRAGWQLAWLLLARWTPPPLHRWRRFVLTRFGARVGAGARVYSSVRIWYPPNLDLGTNACLGPGVNCYNQGRITVGDGAIVSQGAHLCAGTHDVADPFFQLVTRPIVIGARAWIAAEAFVGPGVTIGEGSVLGARAVAMRDLGGWEIWSGNPARLLRERRMRDDDA